jgi:tubulin polyglutamylase TTLL5
LKCWLLEINSSPSLEREFLLDEIIKQQLIDDTVHILDVPRFDRARLLEVLERRAMENEGRKSLINPMNNSIQQLNRDLHYILHGRPLRSYG